MAKRTKLIGLLMLAAMPCMAQEVAAPLGLELGKSTCAEAGHRLNIVSKDVSVWADGPILLIPPNSPVQLEGLIEGVIVCNGQDKVVFIGLTFPKGGMKSEVRTATARQLSAKYRNIRSNLPVVGDGFAEWKAPNATIEIVSPHLSFQFDLRYWAQGAKALYTKQREENQRRREQKKSGSL